ncbi:putative Capsular polysaccharide synthesis protein [Monocercomonoides exilis]|uniref:putative Capsular polysaccharide synthesis protein n=1 Tax=Monocercomonoides exilis TaxID=2049356 RepID=UPI003559528B|nr:putative Capsular polysaccharide synthesis protein [Monocercomonoides exilis]|eukprot:MONOS_10586.1-p1 / transcript=MONOS_10586.1 / gene=MONOS_10586 / organism=Monocercomonoides_exilis_PA203 / gene_product=unspecified product / transcript_product=unspecified product / location=Mono_scaffold00487:4785-6172(+) / protein_length=330 / sequence_SO=supercontig / SO=protein_coding / is_pseudo=false
MNASRWSSALEEFDVRCETSSATGTIYSRIRMHIFTFGRNSAFCAFERAALVEEGYAMKTDAHAQDDDSYEVPKIIWLYWEGKLNREVRYLLHNLKEKVKDFTLIFITDSTLHFYMERDEIEYKMKNLPSANKADYYRLKTLYDYGGIWMDATIYVCNETFLEESYREITEAKAELFAFNSWWHPAYHIEMGFLIAPKRSPIVGKAFEEFKYMLSVGGKRYIKDRIKEGIVLKSPAIYVPATDTKRERIRTYLASYVCMQTVVQRDYKGKPNAILKRSEDTYYKLYESCKWEAKCVADRWGNDPEVQQYPLVKFFSGTRGKVKFPEVDVI